MKIRISKWERYNPRSDRKAHSWFRLEINWYDDEKLFDLSPQQKLLWPMLLSIYATKRTSDFIDLNLKFVAHKSGLEEKFIFSTLQVFETKGLIEVGNLTDTATTPNGSQAVTDWHTTNERTNDTNVVPKGTCGLATTPTPPESPKNSKAEMLLKVWNDNCGKLPKAKALNPARTRSVLARLKEHPDLEVWAKAARDIARSPFHSGQNERGWVADFDYFIQPKTIMKSIEGSFNSKQQEKKPQWKPINQSRPQEPNP